MSKVRRDSSSGSKNGKATKRKFTVIFVPYQQKRLETAGAVQRYDESNWAAAAREEHMRQLGIKDS